MRNELELIEKIEAYLQGKLSAKDKIDFEKEIQNDPSLLKEVEVQKEILKGIERVSLKQQTANAYSKYKLGKNFLRWGLGGMGALLIATSIYFIAPSFTSKVNMETDAYKLPTENERGQKIWADADKYLPYQRFAIDNSKDTILQSKSGILFVIPANCFLDKSGKPISGPIEFDVKEALNPTDIMLAGLSTKSGETPLETGGMFFIDGRKNGESLKIDPKNGIYTQVPTSNYKPGMQLYSGERKPDGGIDWVSPKPLEKLLVPVNILTLNFYPPKYLDSLNQWGYNAKNKKFTDSLYYSFASLFGNRVVDTTKSNSKKPSTQPGSAINTPVSSNTPPVPYTAYLFKDSSSWNVDPIYRPDTSYIISEEGSWYGINPAKVKAIWNSKFNNTNLATREFEERMTAIHGTCRPEILDLYVKNLNKNLCTIDSMAYSLDAGIKFREFAARGDGRVKINSKTSKILSRYYESKSKLYTDSIQKTISKFWDEQSQLDVKAVEKDIKHEEAETKRVLENIKTEWQIIQGPSYGTTVTNSGWNNIDKPIIVNHVGVFNVKLNEGGVFERTMVYLVQHDLYSFGRLYYDDMNAMYSGKLNDEVKYDLVCVALKNNQWYVYTETNIRSGIVNRVPLQRISEKDMKDKLSAFAPASQVTDILEDMDYMKFKINDAKRQQKNWEKQMLYSKTLPVIFPCFKGDTPPIVIDM